MSFFEFPNTRTYDSDLRWLIKEYKNLTEAITALEAWKAAVQPDIDDLMDLFNAIERGNLPDSMKEGMTKWLEANALDLVGSLVKHVFFGLSDDGYFVAFIPESWDDITFGTTGLDTFIPGIDYGHLTLSY